VAGRQAAGQAEGGGHQLPHTHHLPTRLPGKYLLLKSRFLYIMGNGKDKKGKENNWTVLGIHDILVRIRTSD
jgi:hypothetical protein